MFSFEALMTGLRDLSNWARAYVLVANAPMMAPMHPVTREWFREFVITRFGKDVVFDSVKGDPLYDILVRQREEYMASNMRSFPAHSTVATIVGKVHVDGLASILSSRARPEGMSERQFRDALTAVPPPKQEERSPMEAVAWKGAGYLALAAPIIVTGAAYRIISRWQRNRIPFKVIFLRNTILFLAASSIYIYCHWRYRRILEWGRTGNEEYF